MTSDEIELKYEGNTTKKVVGTLYVCDWNAADGLDIIWQVNDPNMTVLINESTSDVTVNRVTHAAVAECFDTNSKVYDLTLMTSDWFHGHDVLQIIGIDNTGFYSQELTIDVYTMISPCGTYGHCSSDVDPDCTDTSRCNN